MSSFDGYTYKNKDDRLRGTIIFVEFCGNFYFWSVYNLFIQDYPYNMMEKCLCQQLYKELLGKKVYIIQACG
jgi:hypothetical protein